MATSDMCIGSYPALPSQTMAVTATGPVTENCVIAAGNRYLYDAGSAFDLCTLLAAAINSHSVLAGVTVTISRDRHLAISSATAFALSWPVDGVLRDLLGYTGNLTSNTLHAAPNISPLLWSANRPATYQARLGSNGVPVTDTAVGQAGTGIVTATSYNTYRANVAIWRYVANARVWTTAEAGGEFYAFYRDVLAKFRRFKIWRGVTDDTASTTAITFGAALPSTGAYTYADTASAGRMPWAREFAFTETAHPITIPVVTTPEYT